MVKQYLFRIHHNLIGKTRTFRWTNILRTPLPGVPHQMEFHTTDFLCSLEETTTNLAHQASMLAFADSIIHFDTQIWAIAVFELSDEKDADQTTPVIVLHPYNNPNIGIVTLPYNDPFKYEPSVNQQTGAITYFEPPLSNFTQINGFSCFGLVDGGRTPSGGTIYPDPWHAVVAARDVATGAYQQQMFYKALSFEDWFVDNDENIKCSTIGTLARTRFPLWKATIESLPQAHSGYSFDPNGKLTPRATALSRRTLVGVSNMAQKRRQYIRRSFTVCRVMQEWDLTARRLMQWMWNNDNNGSQSAYPVEYYTMPGNVQHALTATRVPWESLRDNLHWVVDFLNLVNVAQGDHGLAMTLPNTSPETAGHMYQRVLAKLRDSNGEVHRYYVKEITGHQECLRHMIDRIAFIAGAISDYLAEENAYWELVASTGGNPDLALANQLVGIHNRFAAEWPKLVADFYSVLCLMFTWQLTWNTVEKTRAAAGEPVIRNYKGPYAKKYIRFRLGRKALPVIGQPNLLGRFARERPSFVPFRTWSPMLYESGFTQAQADAQAQARADAKALWLYQQEQARLAREQLAWQKVKDYLDQWKLERAARNMPLPDDVWDYRNYTSLDWWKQKSQEQLNVQFALRALDVPNELYSWPSVLHGLARNYIPAFQRHSDAAGWNEKNAPGSSPLERIPETVLTILAQRLTEDGVTTGAWQLVGDAAGEAADYLGDDDETYSPRQFWPPGSFFGF